MAFDVVRAQTAGACYGVQRALDMAIHALDSGKDAGTLGALIHNPIVVDDLNAKGLKMVDNPDAADVSAVIIRSHGVTPAVYDSLQNQDIEVIDATCPHVTRAQKAAASLAADGHTVIVAGESGHPEVEGLSAFARLYSDNVYVLLNPEDIPSDIPEPVGIVVQTTQPKETLERIVEALKGRGIEPKVKDTICQATQKRQAAAEALAKESDCMVVIGGKNSSNTTRLAEICRSFCPKTLHIESANELRSADFSNVSKVGVSAGASTPDTQIEDAIRVLQEISGSL